MANYDMGTMLANVKANTSQYTKGMSDVVKQAEQVTKGAGSKFSAMGSAIQTGLGKIAPAASKMAGGIKAAAGIAITAIGGIALAATAVVGVAGGIFAAISVGAFKLADAAAPLANVKAAFDGLVTSIGVGSGKMLQRLQEASMGMIRNTDLMMQFNKAAQLVSTDFAQRLPEALGPLSKVAASTGQDLDFLLNSLTTGIGRLSPMILDNLGITVDAAAANQAWAEKMGMSVDQMTKAQKQAALFDQVLVKLNENTANMPSIFGSAQQVFGAFRTELQNIKDDVGMDLLPTFTNLFMIFHKFLPAIRAFGQGFAGVFSGIVKVAGSVVKGLLKSMGIDFDAIANNSGKWGENIVMQLAQGMVRAIGAVISALNTLGGIIAHWLSPGSPPRLLPNLPQWGQSAANYFLEGMTMGDVSILRDLSRQVEQYLRSVMPDASSQAIAQAVLDARAALEGAIAGGGDVLSALPAGMQAYASALLQVEQASQAVAAAQAQVATQEQAVAQAQQNLNQITQQYEQALRPISDRLAEIQAERDKFVADQRRGELQQILADAQAAGDLTAVHFAQLELEELDLQDQQSAIEAQQAAEEELAQATIDAAQAELEANQAALEAAQAAADAAEEQLQIQQELLQHQIETNNLMADLIENVNELGGAAGGLSDALGDLATGGTGAMGGLGSSISELANKITGEFAKLTGPAEQLGATWGHVFTTMWKRANDFKNDVKEVVLGVLLSFLELISRLQGYREMWEEVIRLMQWSYRLFMLKVYEVTDAIKTKIQEFVDKWNEGKDAWEGNITLMKEAARLLGEKIHGTIENIKTKIDELKAKFSTRFEEIKTIVNNARDRVQNILDVATQLWQYLNSHVFNLQINFPSPPAWLTGLLSGGLLNPPGEGDTGTGSGGNATANNYRGANSAGGMVNGSVRSGGSSPGNFKLADTIVVRGEDDIRALEAMMRRVMREEMAT